MTSILCPHTERNGSKQSLQKHLTESKNCRLGFRNGLFCSLKRAVSRCETAYIGKQNGTYGKSVDCQFVMKMGKTGVKYSPPDEKFLHLSCAGRDENKRPSDSIHKQKRLANRRKLTATPLRNGSRTAHLPLTIFFMSLSLFNASTGVRLLMSSPSISSRI